eukprot:7672480-Alexandrium_andersonii.AAC.1
MRRVRPSRAPGTDFEALLGPAQFQVRTPGAVLRFAHGESRIEADRNTDEQWADCRLHFGRPTM